jgi:hypothetical protein
VQFNRIVVWMMMTERVFGVLIKVLAIKKGHYTLSRWLVCDSHKIKTPPGTIAGHVRRGAIHAPYIGAPLTNRQWPLLFPR